MANPKPLTDYEGEVRELTAEDAVRAVPFAALSEQERKVLSSRRRGPQKASTKEMISIRLSRDVLEQLRASGSGWQARMDAHLRRWVRNQPSLRAKAAGRK